MQDIILTPHKVYWTVCYTDHISASSYARATNCHKNNGRISMA